MKSQLKIATNYDLKRCKCDKECHRCKAVKMIQEGKFILNETRDDSDLRKQYDAHFQCEN